MIVQLRTPSDRLTRRPGAEQAGGTPSETLLLYDGTVVCLRTIGSAIAEIATRPISVDELAAHLQSLFGAPPSDLLQATAAAVDDLLASGVLEIVEGATQVAAWRISSRAAHVVGAPERVIAMNLDRPDEQPLAILGSGAVIWQELLTTDDGLSLPAVPEDELLARVAKHYATSPEAIIDDVETFLSDLLKRGLIARTG